jgi:cob(I)alamin adenosyltransferase
MPQGQVGEVPDDGLTTRQRRQQPLLMVHTGDGKGKSTAAFGMAMRAWTAGWPVGVFQFTKSPKWKSGEEHAFRVLADSGAGGTVVWHKMGEGWSWLRTQAEDHERAAQEGWAQLRRDLAAETYRLYVLDEFTYPVSNGHLDVDEVIEVFRTRPGNQHIVLTGRRAHPRLVEAADLVTEMTKVRHPMDTGRKGQAGIEW